MNNDNIEQPDSSQPYVGTRNPATGQIDTQLTSHMPRAEFRHKLCELFNLVKAEDIEAESFAFPVSKFLEELMISVKQAINDSNDQLFNRFISYQEQGTLTEFSQKFTRLMDGNLPADTPMESEVSKLWQHFHSVLIKTYAFVNIDEAQKKTQIDFLKNPDQYKYSNIELVYTIFQITMNLLVMYMSLQYKTMGSKKYYDDGGAITASINEVKAYLLKCLDTERDRKFDALVVNMFFFEPSMIREYNLATGDAIGIETVQKKFRAITEQIDCFRHRQGETLVYKFSTNPTFLPHYEKIIKMIRFLNLIQEVHEKLLESKASPNEPTIELLMLNGHQN